MSPRAMRTGDDVTEPGPPATVRGADWVATEIERMIVTGDLLPGQPVRQEQMAERLGVSRLPIREGLRQLASQGSSNIAATPGTPSSGSSSPSSTRST